MSHLVYIIHGSYYHSYTYLAPLTKCSLHLSHNLLVGESSPLTHSTQSHSASILGNNGTPNAFKIALKTWSQNTIKIRIKCCSPRTLLQGLV